jgi:hypothetical protein
MTQTHPGDDPADHARSGDDVLDAVRVAEQGTAVQQAHDLPGAPGSAPVEQVRDDPEMTEGQVVLGEDVAPAGNPDPSAAGSGGAQSIVGARASDRVAAAEPLPDSPAY